MTADAVVALKVFERHLLATSDRGNARVSGSSDALQPSAKRGRREDEQAFRGEPSSVTQHENSGRSLASGAVGQSCEENEGFADMDVLEKRLRCYGARPGVQELVLAEFFQLMIKHPSNSVLVANVLRKISEVYQTTSFVLFLFLFVFCVVVSWCCGWTG